VPGGVVDDFRGLIKRGGFMLTMVDEEGETDSRLGHEKFVGGRDSLQGSPQLWPVWA